MFTCPNCGAHVTGWRCEYCETVFPERKAKADELNKLTADLSKEIDEIVLKMQQDYLELSALCSDFNKTSGAIDSIVNWTVLIPILIGAIGALLIFLS
jgi:hypothetical protein